ncbi:hypothetical protein [Aureimonas psammosilenae]|uniref:hypothetical protein n=1 Tax=Aureimonas psammosilenae TaxID=2495496 RepID=UPI001260B4F6|nr:hypothetical protein [Aureimonas psammosilenae]
MKRPARPRRGRRGTLAEARRGLTRALLLFGSIGAALILIVVPDSARHGRDEGDAEPVLDRTMTGSVDTAKDHDPQEWADARSDAGPCLMFPDGTQRGACQ